MKDESYEKGLASVLIYILLFLAKWVSLIFGVIFVAITIALAVMSIIKGADLPSAFLAQMTAFVGGFELEYATGLIKDLGVIEVEVAVIGYAFAESLLYCLTYVLISKFIQLYNSIYSGDMFTKENVQLINGTIPLSLIAAFAPAVIIYCIVEIIGVFDYSDIMVNGIAFVCVSFILKLIFEKGYETEKKSLRYDKQIADLKAQEDQLRMETIKMEAALKEMKAEKKVDALKKQEKKVKINKKEVKKQEKKVVPKKKEVEKKTTKKTPVKKETVKKTNTKKTAKK